MANIPPIPPLLCNTPPPIDFCDEESSSPSAAAIALDDEFGDFTLAATTEEFAANSDVSSLPRTPFKYELDVSVAENLTNVIPISENSDIAQNILTSHANNVKDHVLNCTAKVLQEDRAEVRNIPLMSQVTELASVPFPNVPLKDSISPLKRDNVFTTSDGSTVTPPATPPPLPLTNNEYNKEEELSEKHEIEGNTVSDTINKPTQVVLLEDLFDDSSDDESHLSKNVKSTQALDENSDDYFAIHIINESESANTKTSITKTLDVEISGVTAFSTSDTGTEAISTDFNADFSKFDDLKPSLVPDEYSMHSKRANENTINCSGNQEDDDDDYNDFQDFIAAPIATNSVDAILEDQEENAIEQIKKSESEEENIDEDFGEFAEAVYPSSSKVASNVSNTPAQPVNSLTSTSTIPDNLNNRLKCLLEMMFPLSNDISSEELKVKPAQRSVLPFASVDMAKALEYQWMNSEMRHSLIKALGIDSRNILFGEKWNSCMPRFAANLSFNPLKPLKTQTTAMTNSSTPSTEDNTHSMASNSVDDINAVKQDVPAIEFDWQNSGIVNAIDGPNEETSSKETETFYVAERGESRTLDSQQQSYVVDVCNTKNVEEINVNCDLTPKATKNPIDYNDGISKPKHIDKILQSVEKNHEECNSSNKVASGQLHGIDNETVATSTYAGPLKETHIYTPPKEESVLVKTKLANEPIDFDYEIAATGIIIDETVVKKEYRDVEYNPGFSLELNNKYVSTEFQNNLKEPATSMQQPSAECDDDFSEFQSVPPQTSSSNLQPIGFAMPNIPLAVSKTKEMIHTRSRTSSPAITENMILSPAILLPQAISIESKSKPSPKIEWGDTTASINPEELARIEELFPQPKGTTTMKSKERVNSHNSTPTHMTNEPKLQPLPQQKNFISISATIANQEQCGVQDDDYWSDFVSVPVKSMMKNSTTSKRSEPNRNNNNSYMEEKQQYINASTNANTMLRSYHPTEQQRQSGNVTSSSGAKIKASVDVCSSNSNDDEWSDFISNTPSLIQPALSQMTPNLCATPQFNSAAWQNANFYNNPLSYYHRSQSNITPPQQIHMMQDFSTASPIRPHIPITTYGPHVHTNQFQVSSSKVAPSISLIPDLAFMAPATSTHTTFVNVLPNSSFGSKK